MALPSRCTVQAPQRAMPQPNFVPVSPRESRMTQSRGVEGSSSTVTDFPLRKKEVTMRLLERANPSTACAHGPDSGRGPQTALICASCVLDATAPIPVTWKLLPGREPLEEHGGERRER